MLAALPWGAAILAWRQCAEAGRRLAWRPSAALLKPLGTSVIGAAALIAVGAGFLVPFGFAILACEIALRPRLAPVPAGALAARRSRLLATAGALGLLLSASTIVTDRYVEACARAELAGQLAMIARGEDEVVVLRDDDLAALPERAHVDGEVTPRELERLVARGATPGRKLFVIADVDDLDEVSPATRAALMSGKVVGWGLETFRLLECTGPAETHSALPGSAAIWLSHARHPAGWPT